MTPWITLGKYFLSESDKNKLIIVLLAFYFFTTYILLKEIENKDIKYYELQALRDSDNTRNSNLVYNLIEEKWKEREARMLDKEKFQKDFEELSKDYKRLYELVTRKQREE